MIFRRKSCNRYLLNKLYINYNNLCINEYRAKAMKYMNIYLYLCSNIYICDQISIFVIKYLIFMLKYPIIEVIVIFSYI